MAGDRPEDGIAEVLRLFGSPDAAIEIRAPGCKMNGSSEPTNIVRRFAPSAVEQAARTARQLSGKAPAVYIVMNGINLSLPLGRTAGTKAADIPHRRFLLIDCDPDRPGTVSSTDAEKAEAWTLAEGVRLALKARGWPDPIVADSGNGYHLVYAIDLPNDSGSTELVKATLEALGRQHDTDAAKVDRKVFDAPRLVKLYGTLAMKGEPTAERPHRYAHLLSRPAELIPVRDDQLRGLVDEGKPAPAPSPPANDKPRRKERGIAKGGGRPTPETRAIAYLKTCDPAVSGAGGHDKTFSVACGVGPGFDLDPETCLRLIREHYNPQCDPPWSEQELRHKVDDAYKVEAGRGFLRDADRPGWKGNGHGSSLKPTGTGGYIEPVRSPQPDDDGPSEDVVDRWPVMPEGAFYGLAGEIVRAALPHTEADPVAVLGQLLVGAGNAFGSGPHLVTGASKHPTILNLGMVGRTASGRKGSSWAAASHPLREMDADWFDKRVTSGLVSGEGLIHHVRDAIIDAEGKVEDHGEPDKRLLVIEEEMSRVLKAMSRDGNTLSEVIRKTWDAPSKLSTLAKNSKNVSTRPHVSIISHVTKTDLKVHFSANDTSNGFGNRFLWICVRKSKDLPDGGDFFSVDWPPLVRRLQDAREFARGIGVVRRDADAAELWRDRYRYLNEERGGMLGAMLGRAAPQVLRIALVYALLDMSREIRIEHLVAALAFWDYVESSAAFIFGDDLADPKADRLLKALREAGTSEGLTRTQIYAQVFNKNLASNEIGRVLDEMLNAGLIHRAKFNQAAGRPVERWFAGRAFR